jgi:hypothetical protein
MLNVSVLQSSRAAPALNDGEYCHPLEKKTGRIRSNANGVLVLQHQSNGAAHLILPVWFQCRVVDPWWMENRDDLRVFMVRDVPRRVSAVRTFRPVQVSCCSHRSKILWKSKKIKTREDHSNTIHILNDKRKTTSILHPLFPTAIIYVNSSLEQQKHTSQAKKVR